MQALLAHHALHPWHVARAEEDGGNHGHYEHNVSMQEEEEGGGDNNKSVPYQPNAEKQSTIHTQAD